MVRFDILDEPTDRKAIHENAILHNDAKGYAREHDSFVLCRSLLYAPSGVVIATTFDFDPLQRPGIEELIRRAGGTIWPR